MNTKRQRLLLIVLLENVPSIGFFMLRYLSDDLRASGWFGALLAAVVCAAYVAGKMRPHPILLGINLYILLITPLIELSLLFGMQPIALELIEYSQSLVLVSVFVTGLFLTVFTNSGFLGVALQSKSTGLRYSVTLLAVSSLAVVWTFLVEGERFAKIGVPLLLLFGIRQFMVARLEDQAEKLGGSSLVVPVAIGTQVQDLDA